MNDLREWSEEGATPEELAIVAAGRRERPGSDASRRTLVALGLGAAVTSTSSAAASAAGGVGFLTKIIFGILVSGLGAGALWVGSRPAPEPPPPHATVSEAPIAAAEPPPIESVAEEAPPAPTAPEAAAEPSSAPRARQPVTAPVRSAAPASTLSQEVAALAGPHAALADRDPDAALRALDQYRKKFPKGAMASEETVLRVQALLARGENKKAIALADTFCASHPDSPYAGRVRDLVRDARKK